MEKQQDKTAAERQKTKYERKMEQRREQEKKDKRQVMLLKVCGILLAAVLICAVAVSIFMPVWQKYDAVNGTYVTVGSHGISRQEYDYYYDDIVNSYASMLASFGGGDVDFSGDLSKQQYSDTQTWHDLFDEMAMEQIRRNKVLGDLADEAGFVYDDTEDFAAFMTSVDNAAANAGLGVMDYYKEAYGQYITAEAVEKYAKEGLRANAYYRELAEKNAPSAEEITAVYESDKDSYDLVDFRSFAFTADISEEAGEEEIAAAMKEIQTKAEEMDNRLRKGEDFNTLCAEYAPEDQKENYEQDADRSLRTDTTYAGVPNALKEWAFDESRKEGDLIVETDEDNHYCYVAQFIGRKYNENTEDSISATLSYERADEIVAELMTQYE